MQSAMGGMNLSEGVEVFASVQSLNGKDSPLYTAKIIIYF